MNFGSTSSAVTGRRHMPSGRAKALSSRPCRSVTTVDRSVALGKGGGNARSARSRPSTISASTAAPAAIAGSSGGSRRPSRDFHSAGRGAGIQLRPVHVLDHRRRMDVAARRYRPHHIGEGERARFLWIAIEGDDKPVGPNLAMRRRDLRQPVERREIRTLDELRVVHLEPGRQQIGDGDPGRPARTYFVTLMTARNRSFCATWLISASDPSRWK